MPQGNPRRASANKEPSPAAVVVIPTYNEAPNLRKLAEQIMALDIPGLEILFVDDASPDGTGDLAEELSMIHGGRISVLRRNAKLGLGTAYLAGFQKALDSHAAAIIQMDGDFSHSPKYIPLLLTSLDHADIAIGARWVPGGHVDPRWSFGRRALSRGGSAYARFILGLRVHDATTGFKSFRREALESIKLSDFRSRGFVFQVEMAYACQRGGYKVTEVPITFRERAAGKSKMSLKIIIEALWQILSIRLRRKPSNQ
ncbi:polyprenol monophosphomannose synthase [Dehalococcoidia bacterium]|nr:polyprenol monophosphomannose synthase [Dehalococcoidia bacterium]